MPVPFSIRESAAGSVVHMALAGDVDLAAVPGIQAQVSAHLADDGVTGVVIDLAAVTFLDSSGIGALIGSLRSAQETGRSFHVINIGGRVKDVLDMTGVTTYLTTGES